MAPSAFQNHSFNKSLKMAAAGILNVMISCTNALTYDEYFKPFIHYWAKKAAAFMWSTENGGQNKLSQKVGGSKSISDRPREASYSVLFFQDITPTRMTMLSFSSSLWPGGLRTQQPHYFLTSCADALFIDDVLGSAPLFVTTPHACKRQRAALLNVFFFAGAHDFPFLAVWPCPSEDPSNCTLQGTF